MKGQCRAFAESGYVCIAQDCRGRFRSEGEFYAFVNEGKDGFDAIEWAAKQPWSNGKVGTFGGFYLAWDQFHASMYKPPHLTAMFAIVGGANFLEEYARLSFAKDSTERHLGSVDACPALDFCLPSAVGIDMT